MNVVKRVAKNISTLYISHMVITILGLLLNIYIARRLGDVIFGNYSFAFVSAGLFTIFLDFGYDTLLIREVSKKKKVSEKYINNIISFRLFLSFIVIIIASLIINFLDIDPEIQYVLYIFLLYKILISISNVFYSSFRAFEHMEFEAIIQIISNFLRCGIGIILLYFGFGLLELSYAFLFSGFVAVFLCGVISTFKFIKPKITFPFNFVKQTIKTALPLSLISVFSLIFLRIDTVFLSFMKGANVVGWYNASYNLILNFIPIPHLFMQTILPLLSRYSVSSHGSLNNAYNKAFKILFMIGLPISVGISLLSDRFIILFYGLEYSNSIISLQILAWDVLVKFLYFSSAYILISINKQTKMVFAVAITASINIILNFILIPNYSYVGASIATIISELVLLFIYLFYNRKYSFHIEFKKIFPVPIIAIVPVILYLNFFKDQNLFFLVMGSIVIYFSIIFLLKGISRDEIEMVKSIYKK